MAKLFNEKVVLLLQGGGALGSYQGGIFEGLQAHGYKPNWIAGISIGAVNAAIIAGNPPERRLERLHEFWMRVTASITPFPVLEHWFEGAFNQAGAMSALIFGAPGFFTPRLVPPLGEAECHASSLSFYDTSELKSTLEELVDFDRINSTAKDRIRLSIGAVDIEAGNFAYFDSDKRDNPAFFPIRPEHIMASGALPPGLPPIEIGGRYYWDGGLVSNTPLQYVIDEDGDDDVLAFQVDLFSQKGPMPHNLLEASEREKDIRYSSRTRFNTDMMKRRQEVVAAADRLSERLPADLRNDPDLLFLQSRYGVRALTLVHFIYKSKHALSFSKDYEFSRVSIEAHWAAGKADAESTLADPRWRQRKAPEKGSINVLDLGQPAVAAAAQEKIAKADT